VLFRSAVGRQRWDIAVGHHLSVGQGADSRRLGGPSPAVGVLTEDQTPDERSQTHVLPRGLFDTVVIEGAAICLALFRAFPATGL
jgi:hypothetical protein